MSDKTQVMLLCFLTGVLTTIAFEGLIFMWLCILGIIK